MICLKIKKCEYSDYAANTMYIGTFTFHPFFWQNGKLLIEYKTKDFSYFLSFLCIKFIAIIYSVDLVGYTHDVSLDPPVEF